MIEMQTMWGWQPAMYLFLGGLGGGSFIVATVLYFITKGKRAKTAAISMWVSVFSLIVGLLLLLTELIFPLRGLMLWKSFVNFGSWMTIGAWLLLFALIIFIVGAFMMTCKAYPGFWGVKKVGQGFLSALSSFVVIGSILGLGVAVYTGVLLMVADGIPFWNTALLPCLFTISALDVGVALVAVVTFALRKSEPADEGTLRRLEIACCVLVAIEVVVLFGYLLFAKAGGGFEGSVAAAAAASAQVILAGPFSIYFWCLVVVCGLLTPVVASVLCLRMKGADTGILSLTGGLSALVGGCALRFLILMAGIHADVVLNAVMTLIG